MNQRARIIGKLGFALVAGGLVVAVATAVLMFTPVAVKAWGIPCDFLTGGGFIIYKGAHANFGVGGGCKFGSPTWGHLEYLDHGTGLNVHWTSITGYFPDGNTAPNPKTGQPTGARFVCGIARTNLPMPDDTVNFVAYAKDAGEPGVNDTFDIYLRNRVTHAVVYDTLYECYGHYLGSSAPCSPGNGGGGNIQLHKPNPSTSGDFGSYCDF